MFACEYVIRLVLSADRWRYVRCEWPNLPIVLLPFLRPLRVVRSARAVRILRLSRLVAFTSEVGQEAKRFLVRHKLNYTLLELLSRQSERSRMVLERPPPAHRA